MRNIKKKTFYRLEFFSELSLQISSLYREGNYVRFFRLASTLPVIHLLAVAKYFTPMLHHVLNVGKVAFKSPNLKFPTKHLSKLLWIEKFEDLEKFLRSKGVKVENNHVWFGVSNSGDSDNQVVHCYNSSIAGSLKSYFDNIDILVDFS